MESDLQDIQLMVRLTPSLTFHEVADDRKRGRAQIKLDVCSSGPQ